MNDGTVKLDQQHTALASWASKNITKLVDFISQSQIDLFIEQNIMKDSAELDKVFTEFLQTFGKQESTSISLKGNITDASKKFMQDLLLRKSKCEEMKLKQKRLEEDAKKKQKQKKKEKIAQLKSANREMCHCQALIHNLLTNCSGCGRIICTEEGEGECLFCGNFVESDTILSSLDKTEDPTYRKALENIKKMIEIDSSEILHAGIKDQTSDWYEIENDVWQSKEHRDFAKKVREYEEKRIIEEEEALYVTIGTGKKVVSMDKGQVKTREQMIAEANQFYNELANERTCNNMQQDESEDVKEQFKDIRIRSCEYLDAKSKELLQKLKEDARFMEEELIRKAQLREDKQKPKTEIQSLLGDRLQSENPFDEFQKELEKVLKKKKEEEKQLRLTQEQPEQEKEDEKEKELPKNNSKKGRRNNKNAK